MKPVRMVLVGGFLGAGKTTLMAQAGKMLARRGLNVGFITNDQAAGLVDTALLHQTGLEVREVAGACFCCKFDELLLRTGEFSKERQPDVLMTEPVGSCTDLSATVLQPIKKFYGDRFRAAPFSVVVDPSRLKQLLSDPTALFSLNVSYVYSKQLEEADIIVLNKTDQLSAAEIEELTRQLKEKFPNAKIHALSALNGAGVDKWLDLISEDAAAGRNILNIDYDKYADGEARLGWLNAAVKLESSGAKIEWKPFAFDLLRQFKEQFKVLNAEVAHLKLFITADNTGLVGNLTSTKGMPFVFVNGTGASSSNALLILNARVHLDPPALRAAVEETLRSLASKGLRIEISSLECFSPGRPNPTHRFKEVVA